MQEQMAGVENAGPENGGPNCRGAFSGPAFSTPVIRFSIFISCIFHPCYLVLEFQVLHFHPCHLVIHFQVLHFLVLHFQRPLSRRLKLTQRQATSHVTRHHFQGQKVKINLQGVGHIVVASRITCFITMTSGIGLSFYFIRKYYYLGVAFKHCVIVCMFLLLLFSVKQINIY